jgi:cephalosporin hydroxylase
MEDNFYIERKDRIRDTNSREKINRLAMDFLLESFSTTYYYDFDWLGVPIIQYPEDIVRIQMLLWNLKPDCIIETGIARGGSLILSASVLAMLELEDAFKANNSKDHIVLSRKVIGVDLEIRNHTKEAIKDHFLSSRISMIEGSSIDADVVNKVSNLCAEHKKIVVLLDSNHSELHVLNELRAYSKLVSIGSYIVVYDTIAEFLGKDVMPQKGWGVGNNPYTAIIKFMEENDSFQYDENYNNLVCVSACQYGFLKRIK